ncbi:hypothetical protein ACP4OV_015071 [Aristida adscensionis]
MPSRRSPDKAAPPPPEQLGVQAGAGYSSDWLPPPPSELHARIAARMAKFICRCVVASGVAIFT